MGVLEVCPLESERKCVPRVGIHHAWQDFGTLRDFKSPSLISLSTAHSLNDASVWSRRELLKNNLAGASLLPPNVHSGFNQTAGKMR